jgi:hypothetical protein
MFLRVLNSHLEELRRRRCAWLLVLLRAVHGLMRTSWG